MLTGNLVLVRTAKDRVIPRYLNREAQQWLEVAESLRLVFKDGVGMSRAEIEDEIDAVIGGEAATLVHKGLAKVLEDRAEFEVVADVPPDQLRAKVFEAAAAHRQTLRAQGPRAPFRRDEVLGQVGAEVGLDAEAVASALFADLKDENRMLAFSDLGARALIDRYNVALAQSVLLRSVLVTAHVRDESPARMRQLFRWLKFHRLLYRVEGNGREGYTLHIDGPLSLFSSTTRYGLQMALFLPALLLCREFRLDAELRWGPKREPRTFHLESKDGLVSHYNDRADYVPAEIQAFLDRLRTLAPQWSSSEATEVVPLGREAVWVPDYRFLHAPTGTDVLVEVLGFWKRSTLDRLLKLLPEHGPPRYALLLSDRMKVDEGTLEALTGPVLRFKEIPNAGEFINLLNRLLPGGSLPLG